MSRADDAARALHEQSRRKAGPFVKLNCAAVPAVPSSPGVVQESVTLLKLPWARAYAGIKSRPARIHTVERRGVIDPSNLPFRAGRSTLRRERPRGF